MDRISDPKPDAAAAAAALRLALDGTARRLRPLVLSLDGPATWAAIDSSTEWADRAGHLFEALTLLAAHVEPYAASPETAACRVRAAAEAAAERQEGKGTAGR
ncbi:hypothetical protein ABT237_23060 [Streptomyces sp. NPDC001581]|uniref:hypothetical protein n=1 Tax=Streptomyces sp. NPDC001581 TaxID=3154386 RepID=UPI003319F4C2